MLGTAPRKIFLSFKRLANCARIVPKFRVAIPLESMNRLEAKVIGLCRDRVSFDCNHLKFYGADSQLQSRKELLGTANGP